MKILLYIFASLLLSNVAGAEDMLSQDELAARIYDLSHFDDAPKDGSGTGFALFGPVNAAREGNIEVNDCTATFRLFGKDIEVGRFLTYEGSADIQITDIQTLENGKLYQFYAANQNGWSVDDPSPYGVLAFLVRDGGSFPAKWRSAVNFIDPQIAAHRVPMKDVLTYSMLYELRPLEDENQIRDLTLAYQEYQRRFCFLVS